MAGTHPNQDFKAKTFALDEETSLVETTDLELTCSVDQSLCWTKAIVNSDGDILLKSQALVFSYLGKVLNGKREESWLKQKERGKKSHH